jgi:3-phytase
MATISGTSGDDKDLRIGVGKSGDTLLGLAGNDELDAGVGAGNNILRGGDGNDKLYAKTNDQLFGDAGDDELNSDIGGSGINNTLSGGDGNDKLYANRNDILSGDAGDDELFAGLGGNTLTGGKGRDVFRIANTSVPDTVNTIADFSAISDTIRVNLTGVTQLSDLTFTQSGADAIISLKADGKQLAIVKSTLISNLNATNVVIAESTPNNATVNRAPTITVNTATLSIDENSSANTIVGSPVTASDADSDDNLFFAITSGNTDINGNGKTPFAIDIKTGEIKVNDANDLDFETNSIFNLKITANDDLGSSSEAAVTVNLKNVIDPVSTNYDFTNLPKLGTTSKGQDILLGGFSGLFFQGTNATNGNLKFTTLTDRGPNGEPTGQNRPFLLPNFQPEIVSFELNQTTGALSIIKRTGLFRADGTTKLTGLPNLQAGAGGTAYTDEIGVDLDGKVLTNDPFGIDSEGIVIADNGNYWVVDEYRPAIYEFDINGKMLNRFIPKGTATAPNPDAAAGTFGTEVLPEVYAQRRANRGFEAVALEGNKLYAFIQSAIDNPDNAGDTTSRNSRNLRILEFDIVTKTVTGEYLYLLDSISASGLFRTDKLGDAVSLGNKKFAVVERDDVFNSDSKKLIYQIDLANATNINNTANFTLPSGKTIEQLTESELTAAGIKVVTKNLIANAAKSGYTGVDKLEGLALVDSNTLALINDNDFNVSGSSTPAKLGLLSLPNALPIALKFEKNDSDIFSVGSGTKPKPALSFTVNSNGANQVGELGVFIVDDADGNIDGLAPNASGYAEKALARAKVIFSAIDNNPNGFNANGLSRLLEFNDSDKFRFYVINDKATTTSSVLANKSFDKVTFSTSTILNFRETSGVNKITFNNLDITIAPSDDALAIGTGLQDKTDGEVLDLTKGFDTTAFSKVNAEFTVNREAAFNNFVGFYKIENAKGDIKKSDGSIVSVGQSGYIQAAIAGQVSGIDLSVANQSTATSTGVFTAGSIFAPFIVVNGSPSAILDSNPNNDPAVYFPFLGANTDKGDHIRLLGNNTFGFEDLPSGGDFDYNDIIVKVKLTPVA